MRLIKWRLLLRTVRRRLVARLKPGERLSLRQTLLISLLIFLVSFSIKSLVAVDLSPVMHTAAQPGAGMSSELDARAVTIADGQGVLFPYNHAPSDTKLLAHAPGYPIVLGAIYSALGRSYFNVQLIQNVVNSVTPVIIFLIAGMLLGWRVGAVAGFLAAASHHFSYYSNLILPDSLCALPILGAVYCLVIAEHRRFKPFVLYGLAGVLIGASVWLRPNALAMAPFLGAFLLATTSRFRQAGARVGTMTLATVLTVAPITIRNYLLYGELVLVRIGVGIVLWEGMAEYGGGQFGAVASDGEVAQQEALLYNQPAYADTWQTPDGIQRDRDRVRRGLAVIREHPFWFAGIVVQRMGTMFDYTAQAPLVFRSSDAKLREAGAEARREMEGKAARRGRPLRSIDAVPAGSILAFGQSISWARSPMRAVQRVAKETLLLFILIGAPLVFLVSRRRALFLLMVPLYYLLAQGPLHTEFRYTLPMHYFVFVLAAVTWVLICAGISTVVKKVFMKTRAYGKAEARP